MLTDETLVAQICRQAGLPAGNIQVLTGGQVNQIFLVDTQYVVRLGMREGAFHRLQAETEILQSLAGRVPVPRIYAFGQYQDRVYQVQQYLPGRKLYTLWKDLPALTQETIAAELAEYLKIIHTTTYASFGYACQDTRRYPTWSGMLSEHFQQTVDEIERIQLRLVPGFLDMAREYFDQHRHVLEYGQPRLVHGDISMMNILVHDGHVSALLDFEYAMQAPIDRELFVMEAFCIYPNDYADADNEICSTADFANFIPLLRKHYPALFDVPHLRERVNLYHLESTLSGHLDWRKDNVATIPYDRMAAKEFYMARITNFIFRHGVRMFYE